MVFIGFPEEIASFSKHDVLIREFFYLLCRYAFRRLWSKSINLLLGGFCKILDASENFFVRS